MLVICNGSMKSGSTWMMEIVAAHGRWGPIPECYRNQKWHNPSVDDALFERFMDDAPFESQNLFCKQHWALDDKFRALLANPHIKIINIVRDIRDVLVSRYFHDQRVGLVKTNNVCDYYHHDNGRIRLRKYMNYHVFWHGSGVGAEPFLCQYERLLSDFVAEVRGLFEYLESPLDDAELLCIQEKTSFDKIPVSGDGTFFRKGKAGDWVNYVDARLIADIEELAEQCNYPHALFLA